MSPACAVEPAALTAATSPSPRPFFQALYCCLQLAETAELVAARLLAPAELLVAFGPLTGAADGALLVHAVSPATTTPAARNAMRFILKVRSFPREPATSIQ